MSPKAVKELGAEFGRRPVGTGPFKFVEWVQNQHVKLARNPDYAWGPSYLHKGPAHFATLTFRQIPDAGARLAALESGQVDAIDPADAPDPAPQGRSAVPGEERAAAGHAWGWPMNTKRAPTTDLKVREAMIYALDREGLVRSVHQGVFKPAYGRSRRRRSPTTRRWRRCTPTTPQGGGAPGRGGLEEGPTACGPRTVSRSSSSTTSSTRPPRPSSSRPTSGRSGSRRTSRLQEVGTVNQVATEGVKNNLAPLPFASLDPELMSILFHSRNEGKGFSWTFQNIKQIDDLLDQGEVELDPGSGRTSTAASRSWRWRTRCSCRRSSGDHPRLPEPGAGRPVQPAGLRRVLLRDVAEK